MKYNFENYIYFLTIKRIKTIKQKIHSLKIQAITKPCKNILIFLYLRIL